ncbi:MAG: hypothetical protein Q9221_006900 [Calogaya cf. arnoldii]
MSVQSLLGSSNLVAIGIGAGDVATLFTLGRRIGNWLTASLGDAELLALLEEDEFDILQRRGIMDMGRFQSRWNSSLKLLENGNLTHFEGEAVETLLRKSSRFTAIMMCIVAALDEFASASTKDQAQYTSSSDVAGIAYCLCHLSFEILTVENFDHRPASSPGCRLVYNKAPLFTGRGMGSADSRRNEGRRGLSTTISLTQPEETFSIFPIRRELATTCRMAWEEGARAGDSVHLGPGEPGTKAFTEFDFCMRFINRGTPVTEQRRTDTNISRLSSNLAVFNSQEVHEGLGQIVGRIPSEILLRIVDIVRASEESKVAAWLSDEPALEAFTACQAFFMGYYYKIFSDIVDSSLLEIKTVSGCWGYNSASLLHRMQSFFHGADPYHSGSGRQDVFLLSRTRLLSILANLYTTLEVDLPMSPLGTRPSHKELCVGIVGKRIILTKSLIHACKNPTEIAQFVLLDADSGSIPRTVDGLVFTGISKPFPTWEGESPGRQTGMAYLNVSSSVFVTRAAELAPLNPGHADFNFWNATIEAQSEPRPDAFAGHECELDDFIISSRLVTPGRHQPGLPVVVHSRSAPTLRYAAAAWYSEAYDVVLANQCLRKLWSIGRLRTVRTVFVIVARNP